MGGQNMKRRKLKVKRRTARQGLVVWAWRNTWTGDVLLNVKKPVRVHERWDRGGSVIVCSHIFKGRTGKLLKRGADPIKARIPAWTVLKK